MGGVIVTMNRLPNVSALDQVPYLPPVQQYSIPQDVKPKEKATTLGGKCKLSPWIALFPSFFL